jgi:RpiR family carbohydrate utilization transcriptional regulator
MQVTQSLVQKQSYLRKSELNVAGFLLERLSDVIQLRIAELRSQIDVSEAAVISFCSAIGCNGFQDFKMTLAQELTASPSFGQITASETDSTAITIFQETILCCELMK